MKKKVLYNYLPIIKAHYPNVSLENIKLHQDGYDHDVLVIDNHQAFRFPRTRSHGKKDIVENIFLPIFAKVSPIRVQAMESHTDNNTGGTYQTYKFIQGIQLSKEIAESLTKEELVSIATNMGKFLAKLHSFPLDQARAIKMDELDPKGYWKYFEDLYEKIKNVTFSLLSDKEQSWLGVQVRDYIDAAKDKLYEVQVTHHDLLAEHILIDEKTHKLNGVIDFSLRIADPARDFEFLDRYGDIFLETAYANYLPKDEYFDKRRKFYAAHVPIINLYEAIERKDKRMTEIYLKQLREYMVQAKA